MILFSSLTACSVLSNKPSGEGAKESGEKTITVNYYESKTKTYTVTSGQKTVPTDFIAPKGKVIKGLYDELDVQYADYDCIIDLKNVSSIPSTLTAKYEDVNISYLDDDPFMTYDEDPKTVKIYNDLKAKWEFNPAQYPNDKKMIAACLCNPYADLTITVSFYGKGQPKDNTFTSQLIVCNETVGSLKKDVFDSANSYTKYTYTATIKAKQLTNGEYKVTVKSSAGNYSEYMIKNLRVDFSFSFETQE